jgi:hypothetical protein
MAVWLTADNVNPADPSQARVSGTDTFVKQWNDLSGRINNAANTAESQQPKYIADSLNGNPVLRFAQVDDNTGSRLFLGDLSAQFGVPLPDPYPTTTNIGTGGTSLDGAYVNTPTRGVAGALVGSSDPAATFNGSNQRMLVPFSAELNPAAPWTTEIWVQPAALLVSGDLRCAVSNGQFGSPRSGWLIYQDVDKWNLRTYSGVGTGIAAQLTSAAGTASASTWHHLVVVNDATTLHLYVDGIEVGTGVPVGGTVPGASGGTCVGARSDGAFYWPGVADELVIYPTALSAADVTAHYANASSPSPSTPYATLVGSSNPVGYYRLNELAAPVGTRQAATLFAVTTLNSDNMYSVFGNRANDERWMGGNWSQVTPGAFRGGRADFSSQYALMPQTGSHIFAYECSPAAYNFLLNGTLIGTTSGDYNSGNGANWVVGNNASNNGAQLNGDIAELIIYNRILTTEEANRVGAYLEGKYGLDTAYEFTATGYDAWKTANAGNQDADQDYDNDGMPNGVEYFMGGTGSSFTPNPRVAGGKVSWPHDAGATGVTYKVWTSGNLTTWTDVTGATVDEAGFVTYTLPTVAPPTKLFIRLEVQVP